MVFNILSWFTALFIISVYVWRVRIACYLLRRFTAVFILSVFVKNENCL